MRGNKGREVLASLAKREIRKFIAAEVLIIFAILVLAVAYHVSQSSMRLPEAENLKIKDVKIHRRASSLIGVYVANLDGKPAYLSEVDIIKVQAKKMILSVRYTSLTLKPAEVRFLSLTCPLDPEGADYKVMVVTKEGKAANYVFGYP